MPGGLGRGMGSGRRMGGGAGMGRGRGMGGGFGAGPAGECICTSCGFTVPHIQGISCTAQTCPQCGQPMTRKISDMQQPSAEKTIPQGSKAYITAELCKGCRVCMPHCPENAMKWENGKVVIIEDKCTGCFECLSSCPFGAIQAKT